MRKALLLALLVVVPLAFVPWAISFDTAKAFLLSLGALALLAIALQRPGGGTGPARLDLRWSGVSAAAAACWIALAAASFRGPDPWAAAAVLATLLAALVVLAAFENVTTDPAEVLPFALAVSVVLGIAAAYGLLQSVGVDFALRWRDDGRRDPVSTFGNPNGAAEFAAAAIPFAALAAHRCRGGARASAILSILLAAGLLIVARGRAGLLGAACAAAAAAAALLLGSPGRAARAGGLAVALGAAAAVAGGVAWLHDRDGVLPGSLGRSDTATVRVDLARGTARMLAEHPLGVGPGGWPAAHPPYRTEREYRLSLFRDPGEAHCDALESAVEGGWPAAAAILVLAALLLRAGAAAARSGDRGTAAALCASLAAAAGASLFSAPFRRPASLLLAAAAAGMLAALAGGRTLPLAARGMWVVRAVTLLVVLGT
ncbi:MAG TPA: O-antigen ligase family protein, partial [Planctomycetota bacterium]|nr:O-antigen ligase family protein [Planctomycetota bacterium]